nr:MAG: polyprotein [Konjac mosaic virus]
MASIMIGSFACPLVASAKVATGIACEESHANVGIRGAVMTVAHTVMAPIVQVTRPNVTQVNNYGRRLIKQAEDKVELVFENFFNKPEMKESLFKKSHARLVRGRKQSWRLSTPSFEVAQQRQAGVDKLLQEEADFLAGKYDPQDVVGGHVFVRDQLKRGEQVSFKGPFWHRTYKTTHTRTHTLSSPRMGETSLLGLVRGVFKIAKARNLAIEIIGKKVVKARYEQIGRSRYLRFATKHHEGKRSQRDMPIDHSTSLIQNEAVAVSAFKQPLASGITYGDSGLALDTNQLNRVGRTFSGYTIIRGECEGKIFDARSKVTKSIALRMKQFAGVGERFFNKFSEHFVTLRPSVSHECNSAVPVEDCGVVAAVLCQTLFPCGKITCIDCMREYGTTVAYEDVVQDQRLEAAEVFIRAKYPAFTHVSRFLHNYRTLLNSVNHSVEEFLEINKLIGEAKAAPLSHLKTIGETLLKGGRSSQEDLSVATRALLEVARWFRNRKEGIESGSVAAFRNRISAKTQMNPTLMCDNQLDEDGNFVWGERSYHAKRFFNNYFEEIDMTKGYNAYVVRENPNGVRKTAINNLIVTTNLQRLRQHMLGEPVAAHPLSEACISRTGGKYRYPCCCVTADDGTPLTSDIYNPTKNHLVIGNTGDPKFLDLPAEKGAKLFVAKPGYCYLNVFLAMLVNVDKKDAKHFTKMARDIAIEKLQQWPSMMDLATCCYLLSLFHPGIKNAELPRILVDHTTKTMHVIDSYGSLSTGYHILKANTVEQLIQFANPELESEMKHYLVGGTANQLLMPQNAFSLVIKGIYRPKVMLQILEEEPYLLMMTLLSPGVMIALANSGSLERGMQMWIRRDEGIARMFAVIYTLAAKVTTARTLERQLNIIQETAPALFNEIFDGFRTMMSYRMALDLIEVTRNKADSNRTLLEHGYSIFVKSTYEMLEKNYLAELEASWAELSWLGKSRAIWHSRTAFRFSRESLSPVATADMGGKYYLSFQSCVKQTQKRLSSILKQSVTNVQQRMRSTLVSTLSMGFGLINRHMAEIFVTINVLFVVKLFMDIVVQANKLILERQQAGQKIAMLQEEKQLLEIEKLYSDYVKEHKCEPTREEFLKCILDSVGIDFSAEDVKHQHQRSANEAAFESIIAITSLVLMVFDQERSDCVYRILQKLRSLVGISGEVVRHQGSLDEEDTIQFEKWQTIDFELTGSELMAPSIQEMSFKQWWEHQLQNNRTIPHYRTEGHFMEFTRARASIVANEIAHSDHKDILLRGAVGSGKSTGLPYHLAQKGRVLLLEPTRPLAENVWRQLKADPFYMNPTLRMRGTSMFGSSPVHIMTSGYALHYLANNQNIIYEYDFILFDECHVLDASAMAFRSLLAEYDFKGKIIKVSATPPGREVEFTTQFPVDIKIEENLTFDQFVQGQGTKANCDVLQHGNNILVYVASYSEVDMLSKKLSEKNYSVTKVDGRTMKVGSVNIQTHGTIEKPHFVVATNIIENGVTLDVEVVVDFGLKVVAQLDCDNRCMVYTKKSVSFGERIQRLGRVGRQKPGMALRIGTTEKGLMEIPSVIATEAAFMCFTYGLPVMTSGVTTSLLGNCTVRQARTMQNFELSPFYMVNLVRYDGTMHPSIHKILSAYKLRDSEIQLHQLALPYSSLTSWLSVAEYNRIGRQISIDDQVRIPFLAKDIPEAIHEKIWQAVRDNKKDVEIRPMSSASATKVAYTLQRDVTALPRTIRIIEGLIEQEMVKREHFKALVSTNCSHANFSIMGIVNAIKSRYIADHTAENIEKLQRAKNQLIEFKNVANDANTSHLLKTFGSVECVLHQSSNAVSEVLNLKGKWNRSLMTCDLIVTAAVAIGGGYMIVKWFRDRMTEKVIHQARNKRQIQKLKFRDARDAKMGREVYANDDTMEHYFGEAYRKKGKKTGKTKGMGHKKRQFTTFYGVNPDDFSLIRYVDPITGYTVDADPLESVHTIQAEFDAIRHDMIASGETDPQRFYSDHSNRIRAYLQRKNASHALAVDLTAHMPTLVCPSGTIAGFPEREGEVRQSGKFVQDVMPAKNEYEYIAHEGNSLFKGLRDYNPIASSICKLTNDSLHTKTTLYGLGYGPFIITMQHLFAENNGVLRVQSRHGEFVVPNTTTLKMFPCGKRDVLVIQMPKDFPPYPRRLVFRTPVTGEKVCMVGSNFQTKSISSVVSETSPIFPRENCSFWKHLISTKDGDCGLPLVSITDGAILGLHSLTNADGTANYFTDFPPDFKQLVLDSQEAIQWTKAWSYNANTVCYGPMNIVNKPPSGMFKPVKLVSDLDVEAVYVQSKTWVRDELKGNLKAIAYTPSQLVTKHVVKGKCVLFETYLSTHPKSKEKFDKYMGAYAKSRLNKGAFLKDILKYSTDINVGIVDTTCFEAAHDHLVMQLEEWGFKGCEYVTDEDAIFDSLNMKAAVGALYQGKKKDYFAEYSAEDRAQIIFESCERLYNGDMGIWNGSLKAELRPIEKVEQNKTRTFTAAPLDTLLAGKVCVDDFNNYFYSKHTVCPWSVGMTKFYGGWNVLLESFPENWIYCDADGSQFDSSLSPYLINSILNVRLKMMEPWDIGEQMLCNLYTEITYTPIATPDGTIVKKFKGNNSGQPSTVVDNTLMVLTAMYYSLLRSGVSLKEHKEVVHFFINGDDLIIAVKPEEQHLLDVMATHFSELGLNYDFTSRSTQKKDLWFMSHRGVEREGIYIPKLEEERIVSILEWDRSTEPSHRLEAICAAMIEAWGYDWLVHEIRLFYSWVLEQYPYNQLAEQGEAPYVAETALRKLYLDRDANEEELLKYATEQNIEWPQGEQVYHQSGEEEKDEDKKLDAGKQPPTKDKEKESDPSNTEKDGNKQVQTHKDRDIDMGTSGTIAVPRYKIFKSRLRFPMVRGRKIMNMSHLAQYNPEQTDLANTRATQNQFARWFDGVKGDYGLNDAEMDVMLNGLVVWCIENGTSPNINGLWTMMDGEEQIEYPIKPLIDHASPTFRQIMAHFSDIAEAYIEKRNFDGKYMPRYGLLRNLNDFSLARYAFDFYEMTSKTPNRAREAHLQMKAAALRSANTRMFGLDGKVTTKEEDTERHTAEDVTRNLHTLMGVRAI